MRLGDFWDLGVWDEGGQSNGDQYLSCEVVHRQRYITIKSISDV